MVKIIDALRERTRPFYSLEFYPPKDKAEWPAFFEAVDKLKALDPLFASVTYGAGGGSQDNTLAVAAKIRETGITPMPHLTCVNATRERLADFLRELGTIGVDNVMALRGDAPQGEGFSWEAGEFRYASDLVAFARREFPEICLGVAGYPGAHPESPSFSSDILHTKAKLDAGADFVVTQLFFDVREYFALVEGLRAMGVTKPVLPGILPIQSLESIRRILQMCGANIPGKLYLALEDANKTGGAKAVREVGIRFAVEQIRRLIDNGAPGIHLYTLNRAGMCLRIAEEAGIA
ncbi:5,10-methylenetetrahydrofolate reductase [uncultured delta proteobacterium]|uniref:Methylenetetrahydrofolate reductase n=1 Tax=uncultured delta proteobacterium TaxID=34034 RepID=A0A212K1G2_9DELT|nr:5,10-methylenetetrahydrofolate reductase [uncultured delta proteobacterium]